MGGANFDSYHAGFVENDKIAWARRGLCAKNMIAVPQKIIRNQQFVSGTRRARWDMYGRFDLIFARVPILPALSGTIVLVMSARYKTLVALWISTVFHSWQTFQKETSPLAGCVGLPRSRISKTAMQLRHRNTPA